MLYYHVGDKATLYGAVTTEFIAGPRRDRAAVAGFDDPSRGCERSSARSST
jgi:hypothetical protein